MQQIVARELPAPNADEFASGESGMVWENGSFIYGAGTALPAGFIDNALTLSG